MLKAHDVAKKQHRERSQPNERKRWGLLEKKKDYRLRAQDHHRKEAQLKLLRKKVSERNPDEFYHHMVNSKTDKKGILVADRGNQVLDNDTAKLLKTQDSGYVRSLQNSERNKIDRLEAGLIFDTDSKKHTIFVETDEQVDKFSPTEYFDTTQELLDRPMNRLKKSQLEEGAFAKNEFSSEDRLARYKELDQRSERLASLSNVQQEMDLQRELMKKGDKKKVTLKNGKQVWKWKNVRKR